MPRSKKAGARRPAKLYQRSDFRTLKSLASAWRVAAKVSPEDWPEYTRDQVAARPSFERNVTAGAKRLAEDLGEADLARPLRDLAHDQIALREEIPIQIMRHYVPGGWLPAAEIDGLEHLRRAQRPGGGAVLWIADFALQTPFTYAALAQKAGVHLSHLSGPRHGFSSTRFGMIVLNPIMTTAELRHLHERIVMTDRILPAPVRVLAAMRQLKSRLAENRFVSVTAQVNDWAPVYARFLGGIVRLPYGAPGLAFEMDVPIHPVFPLRRNGQDVVVVEDQIDMPNGLPRRETAIAATHEYVRRLEAHVRRYPEQWRGWRYYVPDGAPAG